LSGKRDPEDGDQEPGPKRRDPLAQSDIPSFVKVRERPLKTHVQGRGGTVFVCPSGWGLPGEAGLNLLGAFGDLARFFTFDPSGTGASTALRAKEDLGSRGPLRSTDTRTAAAPPCAWR